MFELVFVNRRTGKVVYAVTEVTRVRYITSSEVGYDTNYRSGSVSFPRGEKLEVNRIDR